LILDVAKTSF